MPRKEIRLTDQRAIRLIREEQRREGDRVATKTLLRIIDKHFSISGEPKKVAA